MQHQKSKFSIPASVTYLNCAYMSPMLKAVEKAGIEGIRRKRNPFAVSSQDFFTESAALRAEFEKLVNAPGGSTAIISSVSYGMAAVAKNTKLKAGEKIIVASEQFPSNYYPWQRLAMEQQATLEAVSPPAHAEERGRHWNERLLNSIDARTKLVALGHVHWADGTKFDLKAIRKRSREVGALLVIDGTQSVGALPFDVSEIQPDALICAGYKWLMGPYSIGLAYYGDHFKQGIPVEENWINRRDSEDFTALVNYQAAYQPGALRYEVGEHSNFILVPMMLQALKQLNQWTPENIQAYCKKISAKSIAQLRKAGYWIEEESGRGHHLFGIRFPEGVSVDSIKEQMKRRKISVSFRGNSMRVAPNVYNLASDFEKLTDVLI